MNTKLLEPGISATGQITAADIEAIRAAGFKSVVCNRPDGEAPDQPPAGAIAAAAKAADLQFSYLPVVSGAITAQDVAAFSALLSELPRPILAYCRSGARSENLWSQTK